MLEKIQENSAAGFTASLISGTMGAGLGGASQIAQFWWSSTTKKAIISAVSIDGLGGSATAFTAGFANLKLFIGRGQTAAGSGGNAATVTGDNNKMRVSTPTTAIGDLRSASTTNLTAGAGITLDSQPVGLAAFSVGVVVSVQYIAGRLYLFQASETMKPIILTTNEALVLVATVPATGTWQFGVTFAWKEAVNYQ